MVYGDSPANGVRAVLAPFAPAIRMCSSRLVFVQEFFRVA
jgi:hypothetical protein